VAALVERARALDGEAWEVLYRLLYPRMLGYARGRLDDDRARDAVSETMARAVSGIGRFVWRKGGFESWMFSILHNVVVDAQRRSLRTVPSSAPPVLSEPSEPSDELLATEEARAVRVAFGRLRPAEQELLRLRVVAGFSSDEVARILGKRPGAVRMAQARALARLRELLEGGGT